MTNTGTVQALFDAYLAQDRATVTRLLADDFVFTSPQDDHIDQAADLERCFPTAHRFRSHAILELAPPSPTASSPSTGTSCRTASATATPSGSRSATLHAGIPTRPDDR